MNFIWEMTEEGLDRLYNGSGTDNYCGGMYFGKCKCEFVFEETGEEHIPFTNLYILGIDDGYAELEDGTPYSFCDDCLALPVPEEFTTFEEFKTVCEQRAIKAFRTFNKNYATYAEGPTQVDIWKQPIKSTQDAIHEQLTTYIYNFIDKHPNDHIRVIRYTPAPDKLDEYGNLYCDEEGKSETVFDSTTGDGDFPPDLLMKEITSISECTTSDGKIVYELEYVPDEYYFLY